MTERRSDDRWIEWAGGECPVPPNTHVFVRFQQSKYESHPVESERPNRAKSLWWDRRFHGKNEPDPANIVAYRVVSRFAAGAAA